MYGGQFPHMGGHHCVYVRQKQCVFQSCIVSIVNEFCWEE
jgi:hypothetical protein